MFGMKRSVDDKQGGGDEQENLRSVDALVAELCRERGVVSCRKMVIRGTIVRLFRLHERDPFPGLMRTKQC